MIDRKHNKLYVVLICVALAVVTFIAYEPIRHNDFVSLDDNEYVVDNPNVTQGITLKSIIWAFTTPHSGNWHSLTWLSHMLDCRLFGLNPMGHHLTSLLLHAANALLLFFVLKKMTAAPWSSAFVAAAFALHPLHVESVAWVSERKDALSGFFWMLTMLAYVRYAEQPGVKRYLPVIIALCLGLLSKSMLVTLPFALLLLDYWPLDRLQPPHTRSEEHSKEAGPPKGPYHTAPLWRLIVEKVPLFTLSAVASVITFVVQQSAGAAELTEKLPLHFRLSNALVSYISYIGKTLYPGRLAAYYPLSRIPLWQPVVCFAVLIVISILVVISRRKYLVVGWLWYLGTLIPVIGLVQVGSQAMADRYTYIPSVGLFIIVAYGAAELAAKWRLRKTWLAASAVLILAALVILTRIQVRYWKDSSALYEHGIEVTKNNARMHNWYGLVLIQKQQLDEAASHFAQAVRINPRYAEAMSCLGKTLLLQGKADQAVNCFNAVLVNHKDWPEVYANLGQAYLTLGREKLAVDSLSECVRLDPNNIRALNNLAWVLATASDPKLRNPAAAVEYALKACKLQPDDPGLLDTLAVAYAAAGNFPDAVKTAEEAVKLFEAAGQPAIADQIRQRLALYQSNRPYDGP